MNKARRKNPIGIFDSGVGGLTVFKALREALPHEDFIYLGDTARLPYGAKSPETVTQYALQAAKFLMKDNIKFLVVACNTASALALTHLQYMLPELPCLGVIEDSASEAAVRSKSGRIAVLATESTVKSGAYPAMIKKYRPDAEIKMLACNLLVALVEEDWCKGIETNVVLKRYLKELGSNFDTLVLGCTHFPLLTSSLRELLPNDVIIVDSAGAAARAVKDALRGQNLLKGAPLKGNSRFQVTDSPERFALLAKHFLNSDIADDITFAYLLPSSPANKPSSTLTSTAVISSKTVKAS